MKRSVWLTSFWGFDPSLWGGVGFTKEYDRDAFLRSASPGSLLAVYVTRAKGPREMRGKLVGLLEITHETGPMQTFTSPREWAAAERDAGRKGKWVFGVRASRAWEVVEEDWRDVAALFPRTYENHNAQIIGSRGVQIEPAEAEKIDHLWIREVPIYGCSWFNSTRLDTLANALSPTNAVTPSSKPYLAKESDGPKKLYVLRLNGNYTHFLGTKRGDLSDMHVIKVGFSKSPRSRVRQIQSSYPDCEFCWEVAWEYPSGDNAYANARIAIEGEDAMKKRLIEEGAISLGGEFFLADDNLFERIRSVGRYYADRAQLAYEALDQGIQS